MLTLVLVSAGCGSDDSGQDERASSDEVIRIGWVGPLTAGAVSEGEQMLAAAQIAVEEVNADGGLLGRELELVARDTRADPDTGVAAMEDLIDNEGVVAVIGEVHSSVALAEIEVAHDRGIPFVVSDAWADEITGVGFDEVFRIAPTNSLIYELVSAWLVSEGFSQVAVVVEATAYGANATSIIERELDAAGVGSTFIDVDAASIDVDAVVETLGSEPADLIALLIGSDTAFELLKGICDAGLAPTADTALYVGAGPGVASGLWDAVGDCGTYVIAENPALPFDQWNGTALRVAGALGASSGSAAIGGFAGYDSLWVVAEAIQRAGSTESADVIAALAETDFAGSRGTYSFSTETDPAWHFQQFLDPPVSIIQYSQSGEMPAGAPVLAPTKWATLDRIATPG